MKRFALTLHSGYGYTRIMHHTVCACAPTRVDFGGGTLDIHPLYLFVGHNITLNAAIDLEARVWLRRRDDARVTITSRDTGTSLHADSLLALPVDGPLALISRVLRHYALPVGVDVTIEMLPPFGSGLGASSALFIALSHAVLALLDRPRDPERIITVSNNLEAQLMGMPAGTQDYYPPTYGGISALHYTVDGMRHEALDPTGELLTALQDHLVVTYTNITHHSGTTNWTYMRNFFDGVPATVASLRAIQATAEGFYQAFRARDIPRIARLLHEEWGNRQGLSDGVTTPEIDAMIVAARDAGAWASKLCGAGGGGCMVTLCAPEHRARIITALTAAGATCLDAHLTRQGVRVTVDGLDA